MSARALVSKNPTTASLLHDRYHTIYEQGLNHFSINYDWENIASSYQQYFPHFIKKGIEYELYCPSLMDFDIETSAKH